MQQNIWTQVSHSDCFLVFCFISLLFIFPSHTHALCKTACPENHPSLQMNTGCAVSVFSFYVLLTAQHHMGSPHQLPEELGTVLQQWPPWGLLLWVLLSASTKWNKVASMKVCGIPAFISVEFIMLTLTKNLTAGYKDVLFCTFIFFLYITVNIGSCLLYKSSVVL